MHDTEHPQSAQIAPNHPNIFRYAPSELSQDAAIAWLLEWADKSSKPFNPALHNAGLDLLNAILAQHGQHLSEAPRIEVRTQEQHIDITCRINDDLFLIIEDKTHTDTHSRQLERYFEYAQKAEPGRGVLPTLLKTGDQSSYRHITEAGYKAFLRKDLLETLEPKQAEIQSDTFQDFVKTLRSREEAIQSFNNLAFAQWTPEAWIGFYQYLQTQINDLEWGYVSNPAGGFWGAWWHRRTWGDHAIYLQLEQGPLCIRIKYQGEADHRQIISACRDALNHAGNALGLQEISNSRRFRAGRTMTVTTENNWFSLNQNGTLDLNVTLQRLKAEASRIDAITAEEKRQV